MSPRAAWSRRHFLRAGRTRVAYIGGQVISSTNLDRKTGFFARLAEAGIEPVLALDGAFTHQWGLRGLVPCWRGFPRSRQYFAPTTISPSGSLITCVSIAGGACPKMWAVVGFDDIPGAAWPAYNLTDRSPADRRNDHPHARTVGCTGYGRACPYPAARRVHLPQELLTASAERSERG